MSLQETIRAAVETAFRAAGDLVFTVQWTRQTPGIYDPATGTRAVTTANRNVRAIEDKISSTTATRLELSNSAVRLWIPAADFEVAPAIEPTLKDKFQHRGKTYTARECTFVGTKAVWEVHGDL